MHARQRPFSPLRRILHECRAEEDVENLRPLSEGLTANVQRLRAEIEERKTELSGLNARLLIQRDQESNHLAATSRSILEHQCNIMSDSIRSMQHEIEVRCDRDAADSASFAPFAPCVFARPCDATKAVYMHITYC